EPLCASECRRPPDPPPSTLLVSSLFIPASAPQLYALSLHDALPISAPRRCATRGSRRRCSRYRRVAFHDPVDSGDTADHPRSGRSEEHTSELQSRFDLVCRLLLEKKKQLAIQHQPRIRRTTQS